MIKTVLELDFLDAADKKFKISVPDPKEDLEEVQVQATMEAILEKNIFISNNTHLVKPVGARVITTTVANMEF
nr:DUF2922 domain-containing protein [Tissierella sp.]